MKFQDAEILSAYLDNQLSADDARRLESRLSHSRELQDLLRDLRISRHLLRKSPKRAAPRNFTLKPDNRRVQGPAPRAVPMLRLASVLAALLFVSAVAVNSLAPLSRNLAAAPALGKGGGGGEPIPTAMLPLQEAPMGAAPAATAAAEDSMRAAAPSAQEALPAPSGALAPEATATRPQAAPIPLSWELILAVAAILLGCTGWYVGRLSARNIRSRWLDK